MTRKTRLIILLACIVCFFVIAPVLVAYSMGYRFDFEKMKLTATGGIYVRSFPAPEKVVIDSKITEKPGIFSNATFTQSLLPDEHTVLVQKTGYYDYFKTISVQEKEVTKLENILLIKRDLQFLPVPEIIKSPFDQQPEPKKPEGLTEKLVAFEVSSNNVIWLGADGFLYQSDTAPQKLTETAIKISKTGIYKIIVSNHNIFLDNNGTLMFLNAEKKELETLAAAKDAKISPDGKNIIYYTNNNIYILELPILEKSESELLYKSAEKITECLWLNNDYIIFIAGSKITISEIDSRGNINSITLPQAADKIFLNRQEGRLYVLNAKELLVSEKIIP